MPASMTTVSAILKEIYEAPLRKQLNEDVVALKRLERSSSGITSQVGGKYVTFPIHYGRNSGIGARREMENLPVAGNQATAAAQVNLKYLYGAIAMSGQTFELADKNYQAFIGAMDLEVNGLKNDLAKDINRQIYSTGGGKIATVSTTGANVNPVVATGLNSLQIGMVFDTYTGTNYNAGTDTVRDSAVTITGIDVANSKITVSPSVTWVSGDVIVRSGSGFREWTGLASIVSATGKLYNVDPANVPVWKSTAATAVGTLSESAILKNIDAVTTEGAATSLLLTTLGVRRSYFNLLTANRRYVGTTEFTGGFKGLAFTTDRGDIPLITDIDCPTGYIYGLSEKDLTVYREADWSFMDRDGSMWSKITNKDAYEARMYQYSELGTSRRNAHFVMTGVTEA